jgi:transposase
MNQPDKLDERQRRHVEQIQAAHPDLQTAYQLSQAFVSMLAERRAKDLDDWLLQAKQSGLRELKSFARGAFAEITRQCARRSLPSGAMDRLKLRSTGGPLQKRLMFGRANFDLLRLRVLRRV